MLCEDNVQVMPFNGFLTAVANDWLPHPLPVYLANEKKTVTSWPGETGSGGHQRIGDRGSIMMATAVVGDEESQNGDRGSGNNHSGSFISMARTPSHNPHLSLSCWRLSAAPQP